MISFAHKPIGAELGSIWRRPTRIDRFKEALFGWYLVHGGSFHPERGHTLDREYFPPAWLAWVRKRFAA